MAMATLTIRNLPEATHKALRLRAAANGRSMEAEARVLLDEGVARAKWLNEREAETLSPEAQAALARLRERFQPKPGERKGELVDRFLAERSEMWSGSK